MTATEKQAPRRSGPTSQRYHRPDGPAAESNPTGYPPSRALRDLLPAIRARRGLTAAQLAERCAELGAPRIDRSVVSKIEADTRNVSLDEAIVLAAALNVAPAHLFTPRDDGQTVNPTPGVTVPAARFRSWVRGGAPLPDASDRDYRLEAPESEYRERSDELVNAELEAGRARRRVRFLRKKARAVADDLAQVEGTSALSGLLAATRPSYDRLVRMLDTIYDEIAEAELELEDAERELAYLRRVESRTDTPPPPPVSGGEFS